eukprot:TRINITY_DN1737_c1_g1_i1.p1 TRINITY_DN1737_c1_g1~~TRINITY_DN1737_c1_g1_i1.p1  ORF type:complete len:290 (-),score=66.15 TRINITY_DN1737_c1_g1_i1:46-915(-)
MEDHIHHDGEGAWTILDQDVLRTPYCQEAYHWHQGKVALFYFVMAVPAVMFFLYMMFSLSRHMRKLRGTESLIMSTYFGFLWVVVLFNLLRSLMAFDNYLDPDLQDCILIAVDFVMFFVEISVLVFMSHQHVVSGREAIFRTVWLTAALALAYAVLQVVLVFVLGIRLYEWTGGAALYWAVQSAMFALIYLIILVLPATAASERMPANRKFYYYCAFLLILNVFRGAGALLNFYSLWCGYCLICTSLFMYFCFFPPLLYSVFMYDFFKEPHMPSYYKEMEASGYFDSDT